jgi:hypothetical protein
VPVQTELSANAVAVLGFEIKGWCSKNKERRLPAYHELAAAGLMELVPGSGTEYHFTETGIKQRENIVTSSASSRIEGGIRHFHAYHAFKTDRVRSFMAALQDVS